jgi:putative peptide zinc metalloprotease protein
LFFVGIALAIVTVFTAFVLPVLKGIRYLLTNAQLRAHRRRALVVSGGGAAAVAGLLLFVPLPYATLAEGVVWIGESSTIRARTDGAILTMAGLAQAQWPAGTELVQMTDPILTASLEVLESQRAELNLRLEAVKLNDVIQGNMLREQIRHTEAQLNVSRRRLADLTIRSGKDGRFLTTLPTGDLAGRFLKRGDTIGYLVGNDDMIIRVVIPQADVDLIRRRTLRIEVRLVEDIERVLPATLLREVPAAQTDIPHAALSTAGGGTIVLDPSRQDRLQPLETLFHFDLAVRYDSLPARLGGRVHVRFDHGREPIAFRMLRGVRQLFLRQFGV